MQRIAEVLKKYSFHFLPIKGRYDKKHGGEPQQTKQTNDQPTNQPFIKLTKQNNPLFFHTTLLSWTCHTLPSHHTVSEQDWKGYQNLEWDAN